jgi:DNA-binding transcriptional LysR family regulator
VKKGRSGTTAPARWRDVSLEEAEIFCLVCQFGSLHAAARQRRQEAGTISKIIRRLEAKVGAALVVRTAQGVSLTQEGQQVHAWAKETLQRSRDFFYGLHRQVPSARQQFLTIAGPSYINMTILPACLSRLHEQSGICFRILDLFPDHLVSQGIGGGFELAAHLGALEWPASWVSKEVASLRWSLYARSGHALGRKATAAEVAEQAFVLPAFLASNGIYEGNDLCPLPWFERHRVFETQSALTALQMVLATDHVAFLPDVAAAELLRRRAVVRIEVSTWPEVRSPLYVSSRGSLVEQGVYKALIAEIQVALGSLA